MPLKHHTYVDYLEDVFYQKKENSQEEIVNFLKLIDTMTESHLFPDLAYFVIDYSRKKYVLLKGNIPKTTGYRPEDFFSGGLDFIMHIVNKDDFRVYNDHIFKDSLGLLKSTPPTEHQQYSFSHNFRLKSEDGHLISTVQRGRYVTSKDSGLPLFSYGTFQDVTSLKKNTSIVQVIDKFVPSEKGGTYKNILTNHYYPNAEDGVLTSREKEILCWIAEGYSIKQLAHKLNIAESTVTNHRKNIMRKTNAKNVAQLIAYVIRNGLI